MVHPATLNTDIVSIICQLLPEESLSALARTAKVLQDPALRELWRSITRLSHLLFPFGSSVDRTARNLYFSDVPTSTQWDRFRFYAQYVRHIVIEQCDVELSCLTILFNHQPLLPYLQSLDLSMPWPNGAFSTISMFFVSSIQELKFYASNPEDLLALDSLLVTVGITAPALRDLTITLDSWEFGTFGISIPFFHNLYTIDIPLTGSQVHSVLSHLSALPSLSRISFSITDSSSTSSDGAKYTFPAAKDLYIVSKFNDLPMHLLAMTRFDNLDNLTIFFTIFETQNDSLSKAISVSCGPFLKQITISNHEDHISHCQPLKFSSFYPLFKFTDLRSFAFEAEYTFHPTDEDIQGIARSWPNLEEIRVDWDLDVPDEDSTSSLTLTGLLLLIEQCTRLMKISMPVDARRIPEVASPISRPGLTIMIDSWYSKTAFPTDLADFLNFVLPDADIWAGDPYGGTRLAEALSLRRYYIKGRQEENKRMINEMQNLQKALDESHLEIVRLRALQN